MSDYNPNPPHPERDPLNNQRGFPPRTGRGLSLMVGILVAVALVAGVMLFAGNRHEPVDQAQRPIDTPVERTVPADAPRAPTLTPPAAPTTPRP